jgi:hypothetical protein
MPETQILSKPDSIEHLLANLDLAIDAAKVVLAIVSLSDQLHRIKYLPEQADRAQLIKKNIIDLEGRLADVRAQAR